MGHGALNVPARVAASLGELTAAEPVFQHAQDVPGAGVLCAVPALLALGLLDGTEKQLNPLLDGYYGLHSILLLLCFMTLGRLDNLEALRYQSPGEWGKLLGLDRAPEVRTLRGKVKHLAANGKGAAWQVELSRNWMQIYQDGVYYLDGHTRVYHGSQTQLPRHYVARQKLCLRATADYWLNALGGAPFFVINKAVDEGLISALENDILPRLEQDAPNLASAEQLANNPKLHRFTIVVDREGYSPALFARLKEKRIAVLTYHKYPKENWDESEFAAYPVTLHHGQVESMRLAERETTLSNKLVVREIRKLNPSDHQTSILSTDYTTPATQLAPRLFARWCQENYLKYAREHFSLDRLASYDIAEMSETVQVVNPTWRELDGKIRSVSGKLTRANAKFGALSINTDIESDKMERYTAKKAKACEEVEQLKTEIGELKAKRKETPRHIAIKDLPKEAQFAQLCTNSKHLIDTIKMLAYRAETAMVNILRPTMTRPDEARALLRDLYGKSADLVPNIEQQTLTVRLHHFANPVSDRAIASLCEEINQTETLFPGTSLRMVFELV